jgi:hypothetical protein
MSVLINNTLISIALCASAVLVMFSLNGAFDAVQSVGRAAMILHGPEGSRTSRRCLPRILSLDRTAISWALPPTQRYAHSGSWKVFRSDLNPFISAWIMH